MDTIHHPAPDPGGLDREGIETRKRVWDFLASEGGVVSVYLFGSVARGADHEESDVDLGVLLRRSAFPSRLERSQERVRLLAGLMAALGRNAVDLIVLNDVPPRFGREVIVRGERILCADPEEDLRFRHRIQLLAADLDVFMRRMDPLKLEALRR
jgi:predicted nucleotidyltransferase